MDSWQSPSGTPQAPKCTNPFCPWCTVCVRPLTLGMGPQGTVISGRCVGQVHLLQVRRQLWQGRADRLATPSSSERHGRSGDCRDFDSDPELHGRLTLKRPVRIPASWVGFADQKLYFGPDIELARCPGRKPRPPDFELGNSLRHAGDYGKSKVNLGCVALLRSRQSQPSIRIPPLTS